MRFILWSVFVLLLLILWVREIRAYVAVRRSEAKEPRGMRRFKRRSAGIVLLLVLGVCYDLSNVFIASADERKDPAALQLELIFYGVFFLIFMALLVIAARDFRDVAEDFVEERQRVTLQALVELDQELRRKVPGSDDLIPPIDFTKTTDKAAESKQDEEPPQA